MTSAAAKAIPFNAHEIEGVDFTRRRLAMALIKEDWNTADRLRGVLDRMLNGNLAALRDRVR